MKKVLLFVVGFTFAACNKCQDCTCADVITSQTSSTEVCQDDFNSNTEYNEAIVALELLGCDCN